MKLHTEAAYPWLLKFSLDKRGDEALLPCFFLAASHLVTALALFRLFYDPIQLNNLKENDCRYVFMCFLCLFYFILFAFVCSPIRMFSADNELKVAHKRV